MKSSVSKQTFVFGVLIVCLMVLIPGLAHFARHYHAMEHKLAVLETSKHTMLAQNSVSQTFEGAYATKIQTTPEVLHRPFESSLVEPIVSPKKGRASKTQAQASTSSESQETPMPAVVRPETDQGAASQDALKNIEQKPSTSDNPEVLIPQKTAKTSPYEEKVLQSKGEESLGHGALIEASDGYSSLDQIELDDDLLTPDFEAVSERLSPNPPQPVKVHAQPQITSFIQLGSFSKLANAKELVHKLQSGGFNAISKVIIAANGRPVSKVMVKVQGSEAQAQVIQQKILHTYHIKGMMIHDAA